MHNPDDEENSKSPNHPHHESMNTGVQSTVMDGWQLAHGGLNTSGQAWVKLLTCQSSFTHAGKGLPKILMVKEKGK